MRLAVVPFFLLLLSCDFQPPKRDPSAPPGPPPPAAATPDAAAAMPVAPPIDANPAVLSPDDGPGPARSVDAMITTDACVDVAAHIAEVVIASITDETVKAQQEQDKTRLVRKVAETCTTDKWSDSARKCFLDGKTGPELEKCGRALAAPKPD